ncbi:MAG: calcium-translocating P-type ATPase, PMCA-type [Bacteroidaceae bacterium]|nr:calcium-translocating P-type ATPase, PMCA-type [Bacteroidaceae bacterium]
MNNFLDKGLNDSQVVANREKFGKNELTPPAHTPLWKQFLEKFSDPIIRILLIAWVLSFGVAIYQVSTGHEGNNAFLEPVGIFVAIMLSTGIGFAFEVSANRKFDILNQIGDESPVKVIRNKQITEVPKKDIVVGDIVLLNTGDEIPADGVLLESISLEVNESSLTGEPSTEKFAEKEKNDPNSTYPSYMVLNGCSVLDGHGVMEVTSVGDATEYGKVYQGAQIENDVETPLNIQLDRLARLVTMLSYIIASLIVVIRVITFFMGDYSTDWVSIGHYFLNTIMIAVTIVVVAVPEGLPMSVTLSLAMSMKRMLVANNLVRKMHACETMGATSVICTDKTGTLTQNQMQVEVTHFYALDKQVMGNNPSIDHLVSESIAVNTTADLNTRPEGRTQVIGNPTEGAVLLWLKQQNIDYASVRHAIPVVEQLTFSTERKYMATVVDSPGMQRRIMYVKGAPEILLHKCNRILTTDGIKEIEAYKEEIENELLGYQNRALRTLAFAYAEVGNQSYFDNGVLNPDIQLTLLGVVAIADPVRHDVPEAIQSCINAGVDVKIITGDTPATAREIGRQIGLWTNEDNDSNITTGEVVAAMSDEELTERVGSLKIIARARPLDKERLVKALQRNGEVVAVTGDGTNDAPALNAAQVGLSMGDGTTVAKEASAITILDNSFTSINKAILWGRSLYRNIQRFIIFQMTINVVACLIVLLGTFLGTESPLTVTQMLWVNLIMDTFAALALASLPPEERVMLEKPRPLSAHIITPSMGRTILVTGGIFVVFLFALLQYFKYNDITAFSQIRWSELFSHFFTFGSDGDISPYELSLFFSTFVLMQFWNMFNAKAFATQTSSFASIWKCPGFMGVGLLIIIGQILIATYGGEMFSVVRLSGDDWKYMLAVTSLVLIVGETVRGVEFFHRKLSKFSEK